MLAVGPPELDDDVLALDVPELAQSLPKRLDDGSLNDMIQSRLGKESDASLATHDLSPDALRRRRQGEHRCAGCASIHDWDLRVDEATSC